jgi:Cu/Ag efflux protein CusF
VVVSDTYQQDLSFENYLDERVKEVDGLKVWELDSSQEYSPNIVLTTEVIKKYEILEATVTLRYKALQALNANETMLVFSAENEGKSIRYEKADLVSAVDDFQELQLNVKMDANIPDKSRMLIYVWNNGKKKVLIEKIKVELKSY